MATPFPNWFDARDYASIQLAINAAAAAPTGGTVYVPAGVYDLPNVVNNTLIIPANQTTGRPIRLLGDGPDQSFIRQTRSADIVNILGDQTVIEGITFQGLQGATAGKGIVIGSPTQTATINKVYLVRCEARQTYSSCLYVVQGVGNRFTSIFCSYDACRFSNNLHDAAILIEQYNAAHAFTNCNVEAFSDHALKLVGCEGVSFIGGSLEGPQASTQPYLYANSATNITVQGVWFEDKPAATVQWFVFLENYCHAWTITGCTFRRTNGLDPKALSIGNAQLGACKAVAVLNAQVVVSAAGSITANNHIAIGNQESEVYVIGGYLQQQGLTGYLPLRISDGSYKSMVVGGNRRLGLPRLTDTEILALQDPLSGQMVYNRTTNRIDAYVNGTWVGLTTGPR